MKDLLVGLNKGGG